MAAAVQTIHELRSLLAKRFPSAVPLPQQQDALRTGIGALDRALPSGGLPRSRITAWTPGPGETALLQHAAAQARARGDRVAWIADAGRAWTSSWDPGILLVRPADAGVALECSEILLQAGGFGLVVLQGAAASEIERVRLSRSLKDQRGALVWVAEESSMAALRIETRLAAEQVRWMRNSLGEPIQIKGVTLSAHVHAPGWERTASISLGFDHFTPRIALEPGVPDRRGAS